MSKGRAPGPAKRSGETGGPEGRETSKEAASLLTIPLKVVTPQQLRSYMAAQQAAQSSSGRSTQ